MRLALSFKSTTEMVLVMGASAGLALSFGEVTRSGGSPVYRGPYEVTPEWQRQILETRGKLMEEDVTIHSIEVQRVSNPANGKTVYIGGIIDG